VEPDDRPDIVAVSGLISDPLLRYTDHLASLYMSAEKRVEKERRRTQKHFDEARRNRQDYQTLFQASQVIIFIDLYNPIPIICSIVFLIYPIPGFCFYGVCVHWRS